MIQIVPPIDFEEKGIFLGIDPGTENLGLAVLHTCNGKPECTLFQVELQRSSDPITRTVGMYKLLSRLINWFCFPMYACIERAAFSKPYRQVELSEVRAAAMIWCHDKEFKTVVGNPMTIRKDVFGSGKIKAREIWTDIPPDAADALGCAYFSMLMGE